MSKIGWFITGFIIGVMFGVSMQIGYDQADRVHEQIRLNDIYSQELYTVQRALNH